VSGAELKKCPLLRLASLSEAPRPDSPGRDTRQLLSNIMGKGESLSTARSALAQPTLAGTDKLYITHSEWAGEFGGEHSVSWSIAALQASCEQSAHRRRAAVRRRRRRLPTLPACRSIAAPFRSSPLRYPWRRQRASPMTLSTFVPRSEASSGLTFDRADHPLLAQARDGPGDGQEAGRRRSHQAHVRPQRRR
jgi:hypothetical protein